MLDVGHPGAGPIVGKMVDYICAYQTETEVQGITLNIEKDDLRQQGQHVERIDVGTRRHTSILTFRRQYTSPSSITQFFTFADTLGAREFLLGSGVFE